MVFENSFKLKPETLPNHVAYRFAELETALILDRIYNLYAATDGADNAYEKAIEFVISFIAPNEPTKDEFINVLRSRNFRPLKLELVHLLLYSGLSIREIVRVSGVSMTTVQKYKNETYPSYSPIFKHWNKQMIQRLVILREHFNLHNLETKYFNFDRFKVDPYRLEAVFNQRTARRGNYKDIQERRKQHEATADDNEEYKEGLVW